MRAETDNDYGNNYLQAEAIIAKLMPTTWHRGQPNEVRNERVRRIAAARGLRRMANQQRQFTEAVAVKVSLLSSGILSELT